MALLPTSIIGVPTHRSRTTSSRKRSSAAMARSPVRSGDAPGRSLPQARPWGASIVPVAVGQELEADPAFEDAVQFHHGRPAALCGGHQSDRRNIAGLAAPHLPKSGAMPARQRRRAGFGSGLNRKDPQNTVVSGPTAPGGRLLCRLPRIVAVSGGRTDPRQGAPSRDHRDSTRKKSKL